MTTDDYKAGFAEFLALVLFCFIGPGAVIASGITAPGAQLTADKLLVISAAHGFAIALLVWATAHISGGHINSAVTIAAMVTGKIATQRGILYMVAQLAGAIVGSFLLAQVIPGGASTGLGAHGLGAGVSVTMGLITEIVLTFALVFVIFMTALHPRGPGNVAPLAIGLTIFVIHLVAVPLTGASVNPSRSFGPAVVAGVWADHWIYWVGPLVGAVMAAIIANQVFLKAEES
ncbi:MAG: aquaporin [Chloroflexi bacterium]|nr:aquaporin [Chloroflexota bacterium]